MSQRFIGQADTCKECGAPIVWATTAATGKWIPLDAGVKVVMCAFGPGEEYRNVQVVRGYTPHHATCPDVDKFRRK